MKNKENFITVCGGIKPIIVEPINRNGVTELVFIIDRSGSMEGFEADTIGGFNSTLKRQKEGDGSVLVSTVLFDNESEVIHDRVDIDEIKPMTTEDYCPGGGTALLDAIGGAIHHIGNVHKYARRQDVPEHTVFVIITDGMENASFKYRRSRVKEMITRQTERYGWEFIFLAANIDAEETAQNIGIKRERAVNYCQDEKGMAVTYEAMCEAISVVRNNADLESGEWRKKLDRDYETRGKK